MKRFILLGFAMILFGLKLDAQTAIKNVVPNYFQNYYHINTYSGKVLDKSLTSGNNSNVYQQNYHGGNNQQWLIMPLHLNSCDAIIINRDGKVLDRHLSQGNLYCHDFTGSTTVLYTNQLFRFDQKSDGIIIECDNLKVGDICLSSLNKDPFDYPSSSAGNLYAGTRIEGNNQKFTFSADDQIQGSNELVSWKTFDKPDDIQIESPPAPASLDDNTLTGTTTQEVQIAQTYIPCVWVHDPGRDFNWKVNNSPFYIVKQYTYYELYESYVASAQLGVTNTWNVKSGISESVATQVSNTIGLTHKSDGGIADVYNTSVSQTFTQALVVTQTTSNTYEQSKTTQIGNAAGEECRIWFWRRMVKYELWRMNESYPIFSWTLRTDQNEYLAFPYYLDIDEVPSKATKDVDQYYEISLTQKSVPFSVTSSNIGKSNAWDVQYSDGADRTFKIYLPSTKTITVSTDNSYTDFDTKIEIFNADYTSTGYYNNNAPYYYSGNPYVSKLSNITLSAGYYYIVVDGYGGAEGNFRLSVTSRTPTDTTDGNIRYNDTGLNDSDEASMLKSCNSNSEIKSDRMSELTINVFPNPAKTFFTIQLSENQDSQLMLIDINGKIVKKIKTHQSTINFDCSSLANGIYSLHIYNGSIRTVKKIVIQR